MSDQLVVRSFYTIHVCSLCGSDEIYSNPEFSWCAECREEMNAEAIEVVPKDAS